MPAPSTVDEFLDLVRRSGVIDEKRLTTLLDRLHSQGLVTSDPRALAGQFIHEGVLTPFQVEQLLQGRWRRFSIGKYKVLERLGAGGMGSVYLCEHTLMRRRVALKVLPATRSKDSSSLDRFYREARAVAALDHPNIVRAYDIDSDDNLHFLVMEHVDGASLQEMIKRAGVGMDPIRTAHYIRQAALGLQHAHEAAGLVHRDIKPGNILVDRNGIVKILDMGLARFFHDEEDPLTKQYDENILGTADYLSPEQAIDSHSVDIRSDIYSLGGTFYYCLTSKTPFVEGSVAQKLIWHQNRQPKPIAEYRDDVPPGLLAIGEKMMAKKPDDRFQTPQQVADALAPWTQTPIPPPPDIEMPQLSLAATRALNITGENSMAGRPSDSGSGSKWASSTSGTSTYISGAPSSSTNSAPPTTPAPGSSLSPPPPGLLPSAPVSAARSAPPPLPSLPPVQPTPLPPTAQPVGFTPPAMPVFVPPTVPNVPPSSASPAPELVLEVPDEPAWDAPQAIDDEDDRDEPYTRRSGPRGQRGSSRSPRGKSKGIGLFWPLVGGGTLVTLALILALVVMLSGPGRNDKTAREPIRVTTRTAGGLTSVLRNVQSGDRIILETDITEENVNVTKANITIEGAEGKTITWRAPPGMADQTKLLNIVGAEGLVVRNLTFDAENRGMAHIQVFSKCDGLKLENLELKGTRQYGLIFVTAAGSREAPMTVENVRIETTRPEQTAVGFMLSRHATIRSTNHLVFRNLNITGPGRKLTQKPVALDKKQPPQIAVDLGSILLPGGLNIETDQ